MNKYGRTTKMTSPPKGMPAGLAAKYAALEGKIDKVVTTNRGLIESGGLSAKGYDPNEMVEIEDKKTGKKTSVPYGSYEHQTAIYFPKDRFAKNFMGIGPGDIGVQKFKGEDLTNYNANPLARRSNAGLKTEELRTSKGSTIFKSGASDVNVGGVFQEQYEQPIKGVTDLPSRYKRENEVLTSYNTMTGELSKMEEDFKQASKKLPTRPAKRNLPKLQGKMSDLPAETTWKDPQAGRYKAKYEIDKTKEGGQDGKWGLHKKYVKTKSGETKLVPSLRVKPSGEHKFVAAGTRYNREEKMAKAFYAPKDDVVQTGGYSDMNELAFDEQGKSQNISKAIKSDIKNIRKEKKGYIAEKTAGGKAIDANSTEVIGKYNKAIKNARLASRYAKKADLSAAGAYSGEWREGGKSKVQYFTPDYEKEGGGKKGAMSGYSASGKQERSRMNQLQTEEGSKMYPYSKSAEDNATNRNSTTERMKKFWGY